MESRRERKKRETDRRIRDAAAEAFEERGFDATTVEAIAEAADVSRATFFNYYPSKEGLLVALADELCEDLSRYLCVDLGSMSSPLSRLRSAVRWLSSATSRWQNTTRDLLLEALRHPEDMPAPVVRLEDLFADLVREAQARGEVRSELRPYEVADAVLGVYLAGYVARMSDGEKDGASVERHALSMLDILIEGTRAPTGPRRDQTVG